MKVMQNGIMIDKSYEEVCHELGFIPKARFVEVTNRGTITFTCGKPQELRELLWAVKCKGYSPAKRLTDAVKVC